MEPFRSLSQHTKLELEHPMLTRLHESLVRAYNYPLCRFKLLLLMAIISLLISGVHYLLSKVVR